MTTKEIQLQYAALPFRKCADGTIEVMLITSRETGRWIIPKGWPVAGLSPSASAAREAQEEAGLLGRLRQVAIGRYHYHKRLPDGAIARCLVEAFALEVEQQLPAWPEQHQRQTRWFALEEAAQAVDEPDLQRLIRILPAALET